MSRKNRIVPIFVSICFLLNTTVSGADLTFSVGLGGAIQDNLAVSSVFDDLTGIQHKDIGNIMLALQTNLLARGTNTLDVESLREDLLLKENTIFNPVNMNFIFSRNEGDGMQVLPNGYISVKTKVKNEQGQLRTYYVVFSPKKDDKGFPMEVFTENEWQKAQSAITSSSALPKRDAQRPADSKAIDRYIQHEQGIDSIIQYAHEHGLARKPDGEMLPYKKIVKDILSNLKIDVTTPKGLLSLEDREIFVIKKTPEIQQMMGTVRIIDDSGKEYHIQYSAHSSNNAVYIFVDEFAFGIFTGTLPAPSIFSAQDLQREFNDAVRKIETSLTPAGTVSIELAHEIGVMLGYPIKGVKDTGLMKGKPYNTISERWLQYLQDEEIAERLEATVVDLNTNLLTRDYAAGETSFANVNGIHPYIMRILAVFYFTRQFQQTRRPFSVNQFLAKYYKLLENRSIGDYIYTLRYRESPRVWYTAGNVWDSAHEDLNTLVSLGILTRYRKSEYGEGYRLTSEGVRVMEMLKVKFGRPAARGIPLSHFSSKQLNILKVIMLSPRLEETQPFSREVFRDEYRELLGTEEGRLLAGRTLSYGSTENLLNGLVKLGILRYGSNKFDYYITPTGEKTIDALRWEPDSAVRSRTKPGKSPEDALKLIGISQSLQNLLQGQGYFTLNDYLAAYRKDGPALEFEALADNPERTARRDLDALVERGIIRIEKIKGKANRYSLTPEDRVVIGAQRTNASNTAAAEAQKLAIEYMNQSTAERLLERSVQRTKPGKSPEDALKLIGTSKSLQNLLQGQGYFTLNDYLAAYRKDGLSLGFEALADNPERTARRDLDALVGHGILEIKKGGGDKANKYILTREGQLKATEACKEQIDLELRTILTTTDYEIEGRRRIGELLVKAFGEEKGNVLKETLDRAASVVRQYPPREHMTEYELLQVIVSQQGEIIEEAFGKTGKQVTRQAGAVSLKNAGQALADAKVVPVSSEEMVTLAHETGTELSRPILEANYTLITTGDFYKDEKEREEDIRNYGSVFNLAQIKPAMPGTTITRILETIKDKGLDPNNVIVQLPRVFAEEGNQLELKRLLIRAPGVRFMIIDTQGLNKEANSSSYRRNVYAMLLLARKIDKDTPEDSGLYRLLNFFMSSILGETKDKAALIAGYMSALVRSDIALIVKTVLSYKPIEKYETPDYDKVAATLIAA